MKLGTLKETPVLRSSLATVKLRDSVITRETSRLFGFTKLVKESNRAEVWNHGVC